MEFKIKIKTNDAGAPVPTPGDREYFWTVFHATTNLKTTTTIVVQCSETQLVETAA